MGLIDRFKAITGDQHAQEKLAQDKLKLQQIKEEIIWQKDITYVDGKPSVTDSSMNSGTIFQLSSKQIIFTTKSPRRFWLQSISYNGPQYHQETSTTSKEKVRKKRHGIAGAAVGTVLAPGVGSIVGAVVGQGTGKDKVKGNSHSVSKNIEDQVPIYLTLRRVNRDEIIKLTIKGTQADFEELQELDLNLQPYDEELDDTVIRESPQHNFQNMEPTMKDKVEDPVITLRKYKSLLDDGIITEDEFEAKKHQILKL